MLQGTREEIAQRLYGGMMKAAIVHSVGSLDRRAMVQIIAEPYATRNRLVASFSFVRRSTPVTYVFLSACLYLPDTESYI